MQISREIRSHTRQRPIHAGGSQIRIYAGQNETYFLPVVSDGRRAAKTSPTVQTANFTGTFANHLADALSIVKRRKRPRPSFCRLRNSTAVSWSWTRPRFSRIPDEIFAYRFYPAFTRQGLPCYGDTSVRLFIISRTLRATSMKLLQHGFIDSRRWHLYRTMFTRSYQMCLNFSLLFVTNVSTEMFHFYPASAYLTSQ